MLSFVFWNIHEIVIWNVLCLRALIIDMHLLRYCTFLKSALVVTTTIINYVFSGLWRHIDAQRRWRCDCFETLESSCESKLRHNPEAILTAVRTSIIVSLLFQVSTNSRSCQPQLNNKSVSRHLHFKVDVSSVSAFQRCINQKICRRVNFDGVVILRNKMKVLWCI